MSSPAVTIKPNTPFQDALKLMHKHRLRRLPVVNVTGELVGIVSERDLLYASPAPDTSLRVWETIYLVSKLQERIIVDSDLSARTPELSAWELTHYLSKLCLREIMNCNVITTRPDALVKDAVRLMLENKVGGLPVVNDSNCVVGMITKTDVLEAFVEIYSGDSGLRLTEKVFERSAC